MTLNNKTHITISIALLVAVFGIFAAGISWKTTTDNRITALEDASSDICETQTAILEKQSEQDAVFAEIRTDLKWIRATLDKEDD